MSRSERSGLLLYDNSQTARWLLFYSRSLIHGEIHVFSFESHALQFDRQHQLAMTHSFKPFDAVILDAVTEYSNYEGM
jgi:hypothetical protein